MVRLKDIATIITLAHQDGADWNFEKALVPICGQQNTQEAREYLLDTFPQFFDVLKYYAPHTLGEKGWEILMRMYCVNSKQAELNSVFPVGSGSFDQIKMIRW